MIVPRRVRAPDQDGALLAEPPLAEVGPLLVENRRRMRDGPELLGRAWGDLRRSARGQAWAVARAYLGESGEPVPASGSESLLLAGHQPELVHPGVWVKNFALAGLAAAHGATSVNLLVDYDTVKTTTLRLPELVGTDPREVHAAALPFDHWADEAPYEERRIRDRALFASLAERAAPLWRTWGFRPLLPEFWTEVLRQAERTPLLGECLAAARRTFERRWGCHNLEAPVSALSRTGAFAWFACHILADLPRFHQTYNDCVHEYRRVYGLRSRNHPVPDLGTDGTWLETPFWAWQVGQERRGRLVARPSDSGIELRVGAEPWPTLPRSAHVLASAWQTLEPRGFKIRPRALTNTLFARLFVADLFLHGIGGGKYDELTDDLIRRFYGQKPPRYLVLSGTLRLPLPAAPVDMETRRGLIRHLRSLRYNPQRHVPPQSAAAAPALRAALQQRADWLARQPQTRRGRRERFVALRQATEELREYVRRDEVNARAELVRCERELAANAIVRRRDYAACLLPEERLRAFFTPLLTNP